MKTMFKLRFFFGFLLLAGVICFFINFYRTKYYSGEMDDINALKQRFVQYDNIPYFKTDGKLFFAERVVQPYHTIEILGVFSDSLEDFKSNEEILDFSEEHIGETFFDDILDHVPDHILHEYDFIRKVDDRYSMVDNGNELHRYWFKTRWVQHGLLYLEHKTGKFMLRLSCR
ncbi:MAG: hypothetical protein J5654_01930 [Victivallales bacterium]|nr:hypothetical protein [Victivallales bacterium]